MSIRIQCFGNLQFTCGGTPITAINTNRLQSLMAFLILRAASPQSREQLASLLWPESDEGQARTNLRQLLHHLRRALPANCCLLISGNRTVQWPRDAACALDVYEFDEAIERAASAGRKGDSAAECAALEAAASLYQDELARGLYDDWLTPLREQLPAAVRVRPGTIGRLTGRARRSGTRQLLDFAVAGENEALVASGNFTLGVCSYHLGQLELSERHMARTLGSGRVSLPPLTLFAWPDVYVFSQSYLSHLLWHRGLPDQAVTASQEAIAAASQVGNPFSMALALYYAALLHTFRRESKQALAHARNAISVCGKHDFAYYRSMAEIVAGWGLAIEEDPAAGLAQLRRGLESLKAMGAELRLPLYHGLLAEVCALNGNMSEGLANLSTAFAFQNKNNEIWSAADLHRRHGDMQRKSGNPAQARSSYQKSIEAARQVGSLMFELRGQARLAALTGELGAVREFLAKFREGFDTPDFQEARGLLNRSARA